jgi:DNA helicase-2/ATP-dependent DNA helicase PcrA
MGAEFCWVEIGLAFLVGHWSDSRIRRERNSVMNEWLENLNEPQREAVEHEDGPVLVIAGAGSGKTRVITCRVAHLIRARGVAPWNILAVTFTNKAAAEMKERVLRLTGEDAAPRFSIATFHSTCASILRRDATRAGLSAKFTICDDSDQKALIREIMREQGIDKSELAPAQAQWIINQAKMRMLGPADVGQLLKSPQEELYVRIFERYQRLLAINDACDFEDLILRCVQLFERNEEARREWADRWPHLLVDEYQDTNFIQFRLVELLARDHRNLCVVGDEDQSIYSWRGAEIGNLLEFQKRFPDARLIRLEQNYRSHGNILKAASVVIANNKERLGKTLWTKRPAGPLLHLIEVGNDRQETLRVVDLIEELRESGLPDREIGVFYRANALSRGLEDRLREREIPYRVVGAVRFYDRKEIKDLLAYLKVAANPNNSLALMRIINMPRRGIGQKTQEAIQAEAMACHGACYQVLLDMLEQKRFPRAAHTRLANFVKQLESWRDAAPKSAPVELLQRILEDTEFIASLGDKKSLEVIGRRENIDELMNAMTQYEQEHPGATLDDYLEMTSLATSLDEQNDRADKVSLMTLHAAKGLEFSVVFLTALDNGIFPNFRALENNALEEERRLFYVGLTRAKDLVVLSRADSRFHNGRQSWNQRSMFLNELPDQLLAPADELDWDAVDDFVQLRRLSPAAAAAAAVALAGNDSAEHSDGQESGADRRPGAGAGSFRRGDRVEHPLLGPGRILSVEMVGGDQKMKLLFDDGTEQTLYARFAHLDRLPPAANS